MTASSNAALAVRGLRKSFGGTPVLSGVDLEVEHGSITALLGPNGAGKTTLIRILSTLLAPDAGHATVAGADVVRHGAAVRNAISLTGQFSAVDDALTGRENLVMMARLRHVASPGAVADSLLERFDLGAAARRTAASYSGGMRRRLDIAMSLVGDPSVLFLDEPTTGLDPAARLEVWETVRRLAEDGTTVLLTTQYLEEAEQLAHRVAILHGGRILVEGSVAELKALLPAAREEYVLRTPTLEEVFLHLTSRDGALPDEPGRGMAA